MNDRYARQIILPEIGEAGQKKLAESSALIIGAGGLGSPAALYLAAAGAGRIGIADADEVRLNNLNRQILYNEGDLGQSKAERAKANLENFNSDIKIETFGRIDESNIGSILSDKKFRLVIDGTDNFETRYTVNSACVENKIPFIYGSVLGWQGQFSLFDSACGPCYQCVYPEAPEDAPTCVRAGVIGTAAGLIGVLQAAEAIKYITGAGETLAGKMMIIDLKNSGFKLLEVSKDPHCKTCGK